MRVAARSSRKVLICLSDCINIVHPPSLVPSGQVDLSFHANQHFQSLEFSSCSQLMHDYWGCLQGMNIDALHLVGCPSTRMACRSALEKMRGLPLTSLLLNAPWQGKKGVASEFAELHYSVARLFKVRCKAHIPKPHRLTPIYAGICLHHPLPHTCKCTLVMRPM